MSVPEPLLLYFLGEYMKPHTWIQVRLFRYPFTDEKPEATRTEGVASGEGLRPDAKAAFSPAPRTAHTSFFPPSFVVLPGTKNPSYFLTKMCFVTNHLVPFHTELA